MINFPTLNILVGIPGSGKSTWCASQLPHSSNIKWISSDAIRQELLNNINNQDANKVVFEEMHKRTLEALNHGVSVLYDATNVSRKSRLSILNKCPRDTQKLCTVIWAPIQTCIQRDTDRNRSVGKVVIDRMLKNFQAPYFDEGYDHIVVQNTAADFLQHKDSYIDYQLQNLHIPHDNPYHSTATIYEHCVNCYNNCNIELPQDIKNAYLWHDIGKPYVKSFINSKGETSDIAHYYGHQGVGAWISYGMSTYNLDVAWLISNHMDPYSNTKYYRALHPSLKQQIDDIHKADCLAH